MPLLLMISGECLHTLAQPITAAFRTRGLESFNPVTKRISKRGSVLKVRGSGYNYRFKHYKSLNVATKTVVVNLSWHNL